MIKRDQYKLLKKSWERTCSKYTDDVMLISDCFEEIYSKYDEPHRAYHNHQHILELLELIEENTLAENKEVHVFAAFFHDVIYNPGSTKNEFDSAEYGESVMQRMNVSSQVISAVSERILATQTHQWFDENIPN